MQAMPDLGALDALAAMQKSVAKSTDAALKSAKAQTTLAKATQSAAKAAKNAIAGFDELHLAAGGGASGGTKKASAAKKAEKEATQLEILWQNTLANLSAMADRLRDLLAPSIAAWQLAFSQIGTAAGIAFAKMSAAAGQLWQESLAPLLRYLCTEFAPGIFNVFATVIAPIFSQIAQSMLTVFAGGFERACAIVKNAIDTLLLPALQFLQQIFSDIIFAVRDTWNKHGAALLADFKTVCSGIFEALTVLYTTVIQPVLAGIGAAIATLWTQHLAPLWQNVVELFAAAGAALLALWNNVLLPFISFMTATFGPMVVAVWQGISTVFGNALGAAADTAAGIVAALHGLCEFLLGAFTGDWQRAWNGVRDIFGGVWNGIVTLLKGAVNAIIDCVNAMTRGVAAGVNGVVGALNGIHVTIPKWVPGFGGQHFGIHLPTVSAPQIPRLARGAVIPPNAEFLAVLGDQKSGRNLEAPEKLIRQIVREESAVSQQFEAQQPVILALDGEVLYRAMMKIKATRGMPIGGAFADAY